MDFHDWYDANLQRLIKGNLHDALQEAWQAAQAEREQTKELIEALHRISITAQNGMSSKHECGNIARAAIAKYEGEK